MVHSKGHRLFFLVIYLLGLVFALHAAEKQPNIVFILTDDQQYGLMGCTGNTIVQTPHIDGLAADGVLFTNAHVTSAICTPSRVSMFLSQYERKHSVNFNSGTSVAPEAWAKSYPVLLRDAGYFTGYIGKNHAPIGDAGYEDLLMQHSFDYWYAGHGHLRFYSKQNHDIFQWAKANTQVEILQEGVDDFFDNDTRLQGAITFLDKRPHDQPFCLSICFNLPHGASTSGMKQKASDPEIYKSLYRDKTIPLPDHYIAKANIRNPRLPESIHHYKDRQTGYNYVDTPSDVKERYLRQMQALTGIDNLVGKLRTNLESLGLAENTIIVFTSDHGLFMGQYGIGGKALCYEICTHVPLIVYDPSSTFKGENAQLVQSIDIAPTLLAKAGVEIPETMQGKDISALLRGEDVAVRDYLFTENLWSTQFGNPRCESVQTKDWKYIRYYKNNNFSALRKKAIADKLGLSINTLYYKVHDAEIATYRSYIEAPLLGEAPVYEELFHLANDPDESTNLVDETEHAAILQLMREQCQAQVIAARGIDAPAVKRYTVDRQAE